MFDLRELNQEDRHLLQSVDDQIIASKQEMNLFSALSEEIFGEIPLQEDEEHLQEFQTQFLCTCDLAGLTWHRPHCMLAK